jgi:hypothetical protein
MRLNPSAHGVYPNVNQPAAAQSTNRNGRPVDAVKNTNERSQARARTQARDSIRLSAEATQKYGQAQLQEHILGKLKEQLAAAGVDFDASAGLDWSPETTAQRIFGFASGMLGVFRDQNPELNESDLIDKFESTVRGAVDTGYGQALEILKGLSIGQDALDTAQTTIDKVHSLFDDFFANLRDKPPAESTTEPSALS